MSHFISKTVSRKSFLKLIVKKDCIYTVNHEAYNFICNGDYIGAKTLIQYRNKYLNRGNWVDYTPLMQAINNNLGLDIIKKLVEFGEPINGLSDDGKSALDYAFNNVINNATNESKEIFYYLINNSGVTLIR